MRVRTTKRARGGFTILEVVLAMGILFVGMTAVLGFLSVGAALARTAELRGASARAIEAVVADLEEAMFPLVGVEEPGSKHALGRAGEPRAVRGRAVPGHPGLVYSAIPTRDPEASAHLAPEYRVDVELSWSAAGATRVQRFTTLLVGEVPFGERMRRIFIEGTASGGSRESVLDG